MATITAAVGGGNWTAGGTWVGGVAPTLSDDVLLTATSGNVTVDAGATCKSLNCTGYTGTLSGTKGLSVGTNTVIGDVTFVSTMTLSWTGALNYNHTSNTSNLTLAGKTLGALTVGANLGSGVVIFVDASAVTNAVTLTAGTLNTNGQTCTWGSFSSSNTSGRTLTLGASQITVNSSITTPWDCSTSTNLTITTNTATVTISGVNAGMQSGGKNWNGLSVVITGSGFSNVGGGGTVANFTRTGTAAITDGVSFATPPTVTGTCTLGGGSTQGINRLLLQSGTVGTQRTLTAAAFVITGDVDFIDMKLAYSGAASWTNTGSAYIGDCGGNAGAVTTNATAPVTTTTTTTGTNNFSAMTWSSRVPLPQDTADITSYASGTLTMDMPRVGTVDFTGSTGGTISFTGVNVSVFGGLTIPTGIGMTGTLSATFAGRGSYTINVAVTMNNAWTVNAPGGTYTLAHNYASNNANGNFTVNFGTFDAAGFTMSVRNFTSTVNNTRTVHMGGGAWSLNGTGAQTLWSISNTGTLSFTNDGSTITLTSSDGAVKTFAGAGLSYGTLQMPTSASASSLTITGSNTFANLDIECTSARTVTLPAGGIQFVSGATTIKGASGHILSFVSSSPGTRTDISANGALTNTFTSLSADVIITSTVTSTHSAPVESQQALTKSASDPVESQQAVLESRVSPVESTSSVRVTSLAPIESVHAVMQTAAAVLEAVAARSTTAVVPIEGLRWLTTLSSDPVEAGRSVTTVAVDVLEALRGLVATADDPIDTSGEAIKSITLELFFHEPGEIVDELLRDGRGVVTITLNS